MSSCSPGKMINHISAVMFSFTLCLALGLGRRQWSWLRTTVMETGSRAGLQVPSCTPIESMDLEFPGLLLRQAQVKAGWVLTWDLGRKCKEWLPYSRAPLHCPKCFSWRCAGPYDQSHMGTALEELGSTVLQIETVVLQGALASCGPFWKEMTESLPWDALGGKKCPLLRLSSSPPFIFTLSCPAVSW